MGEQPCPLCEGRYGTFRWCTVCSSLEQLRFAVLRGFEREDSEELGRRIRDFSSTLLSWGARLQRQREGRTLAQVKAGPVVPAGLGALRPAEPAGPPPTGGDREGAPSASSPATTSKAAPEVPKASRTPERRRRKESKRSRSSRRRRSPGRARHRSARASQGSPTPGS